MSDVLILYLLGRSKHLRPIKDLYEQVMVAKQMVAETGQAPIVVRGIRLDGEIYDLNGTLKQRPDED